MSTMTRHKAWVLTPGGAGGRVGQTPKQCRKKIRTAEAGLEFGVRCFCIFFFFLLRNGLRRKDVIDEVCVQHMGGGSR